MKPLLLFFACALCFPAAAQARPQSSPAQVDGIIRGVMSQLSAQTDTLFHEGDYPRIIALDRIIAEAEPHAIDCYTDAAWLMWSDGLNADAEAFYRLCIRRNPKTSAAYYDYGSFLFHHLHRYDDARRVYGTSVHLRDADILDWRMLAHSYEKLGQLEKAVATWRQIKTRWPNGAPRDGTRGAVDTNNLNKDLALLAAAPETPAP